MTQKELNKLLGNTPKFKLKFRKFDNPKETKIICCFAFMHTAPSRFSIDRNKGDMYAKLEKNGNYINIQDNNYFLDEWVEL